MNTAYLLTHTMVWVYFEVIKGCYGLPQGDKLANDLLHKCLNSAGYHKATTTPGLWRHKWRPIQFCLLVDDFGIEYVGEKHVLHLESTLQEHYSITEDWEGKNLLVLTSNGTMQPHIRRAPVACPSKITFAISFLKWDILRPLNLNFPPTSTVK
jgi:hypothetical protein